MLVYSCVDDSSFAAFLWPEELIDLWADTTLGDLDLGEELVEFIIVADSKLNMSRGDRLLLVLVGAVTRQIEDLHREVLKCCCEEDSATDSNSCCISALFQLSVASADWEDDSSSGGSGNRLTLSLA